jgi:hypothetical protein
MASDLEIKRVESSNGLLELLCFEERTLFRGVFMEMDPGFTWIHQAIIDGHAPLMISLKESVIKFSLSN